MCHVEIKESQEDAKLNDIIIGDLGLGHLTLLSCKTTLSAPKFYGYHSSTAVGNFKPTVQIEVQKHETSNPNEALIMKNLRYNSHIFLAAYH